MAKTRSTAAILGAKALNRTEQRQQDPAPKALLSPASSTTAPQASVVKKLAKTGLKTNRPSTTKLPPACVTFANVDLSDRDLLAKVREHDLEAAEVRIKQAVRRLQDLGVVDANGRRLRAGLPADMAEDSTTDFGG